VTMMPENIYHKWAYLQADKRSS